MVIPAAPLFADMPMLPKSTPETNMDDLHQVFMDFRPSLLRMQEAPPSPMRRVILSSLLFLFAVMICWAFIGQLDIVAVAEGKIVPKTYLKIVQPSESGIIHEILVREGEFVRRGQVLMRLDGTDVNAQRATLLHDRQRLVLTLRRIDAELTGSRFLKTDADPDDLCVSVLAQYEANIAAQAAALSEQMSVLEKARHELKIAEETKARIADSLTHYRQQDEAYERLGKEGHIAHLMVTDKHRERQEKERESRAQDFVIQAAKADIARSEKQFAQIRADYQRDLQTERVDAMSKLTTVEQALTKEDRRFELLELAAPQDGIVKDLATHTIGTVVSPGTIIMTLVPRDEELLAEVWVDNEDIGFIVAGQQAKVKLSAFTFQKYGMLEGTVDRVGADSDSRPGNRESDSDGENDKLAYKTTIGLGEQFLSYKDQRYRLMPGMQVSAEIKLGTRSVMEYLFSPVAKNVLEACRER